MSSKMASIFSQEWLLFLKKKNYKFCIFLTLRFYSIFTIWFEYLPKRLLKDFRLSMSASVIAINLPLKLFRSAVANADTGSLNSLHTLFDI